MKKINLLILHSFIICFFIKFSFASNLTFDGLSKLNKSDIQSLTSLDLQKDNYLESEINELIKDLYKSDLIKDVELTKKDNIYVISIIENSFIQNIYINGNIKIKDEFLINSLNSKTDYFFKQSNIEDDIKLIKNLYRSNGYNNVTINVVTEKFFGNKVNLIFDIDEGTQLKLTNVDFIGNESFSDKYLYSLISTKALNRYNIFSSGSNFNKDIFNFDKEKLLNFYQDKGFFDVKISYQLDRSKLSNYSLTFFLDEGMRYTINEVNFIYLNEESNKYFEKVNVEFDKLLIKNGGFYDTDLLNRHLKKLSEILDRENILDHTFSYQFIQNDDVNEVVFAEQKLQPKFINKIIIEGNSITKDSTLRSKLVIEPGDYVNQFDIAQSKKDLSRLRYVNSVSVSEQTENNNSDIIFNIIENTKTGNFLLGGSFSGDTGFGIGLGLKDSNILGTGNELDLNLNFNTEKTLFKIDYSTYSLLNSNLTNTYTIFNQETDLVSSFGFKRKSQGIGYKIGFKYNENIKFSTGVNIQREEGYAATSSSSIVSDNVGTFDQLNLEFSLNQNNTNNFLYPTNGSSNKLSLKISPSDISDNSYYIFKYNNKFYHNFKNSKNFLFTNNNLGLADSFEGNLNTTNVFSLGGLNFKGFDYRGIGPKTGNIYLGGNKYITSTVGYGSSFLFDEKDNINIKLFYTMGSIWDSDYTSDSEFDLRSSIGVSFDILTAVGPISLSYAVPIEKNQSDTSREFNFSIGTSF